MPYIQSIDISGQTEECKSVNIIIGSNNSGKSTLLRELTNLSTSLAISNSWLWVEKATLRIDNAKKRIRDLFPRVNFETIEDFQVFENDKFTTGTGFSIFRPSITQSYNQYFNPDLVNGYRSLTSDDDSISFSVEIESPNQATSKPNYGVFKLSTVVDVAQEFCESRLGVQLSASVQNILTQKNESIIHHLLNNEAQLKLIQDNIRTVFGIKIGFDHLQQGEKNLRILPDNSIRITNNPKADAENWEKLSQLVQSQGDGIKAYLKLIFSLLDENNTLIFIDEPEAFLHPPQRRELGSLVARLAAEKKKQVFVSTHDSEFLRGALSSTKDIKVFYLKQDGKTRSSQSVELSDFKTLTNNQPEILTERILNSFFYEKTIITESETDRVFYEYASALYHWQTFQNKSFVGMSGIDKVLNLFKSLRGLKLNVAVIVDSDFILTKKYPDHLSNSDLKTKHENFKLAFNHNKLDKNLLKKGGYLYLKSINKSLAKDYLDLLTAYSQNGVFIPQVGELESWSDSAKNDLEHMLDYVSQAKRRKLSNFVKSVLT